MSPTRRAFLKSASAFALASPLAAWEDRFSPQVTFGFSLYGMKSLPLSDGLKACARLGYDAIELAVLPDWPGSPARLSRDNRLQLRKQLQDLKLALPALMENTPLDGDEARHKSQLDRLKAAAELGHDLTPHNPPLIETILGGKSGEWEALKTKFAIRLADWAKLGEQARTVVAIKPHRFGAMNRPEQAVWLLDQVKSPWIALAYDFSHFIHREWSLVDTLKQLLSHTRFIHVKDARKVGDQVQFVLPGDAGDIDYTDYFAKLRQAHFKGCICVEVSAALHTRKDYNPEAAAKRSYGNLAPSLARAGLWIARNP